MFRRRERPARPQGEGEQQQAEGAQQKGPGFFSRLAHFFSFRRRRAEREYLRQQEQAQTHMNSIQDGLQKGAQAMAQEQNPSRRAEIFGQLNASLKHAMPSVEDPANRELFEAVRSGRALTQGEVDFANRLVGAEQAQAVRNQLLGIFFEGFSPQDLQSFANLERSNRREFLEVCKAWALKMNISEAEFEQALMAKISPAHALRPESMGRFSAGQGEQPESHELPEREGQGRQIGGAEPARRAQPPRRRRRFPEEEEAREQAQGEGLEEAGAEGHEFEGAA